MLPAGTAVDFMDADFNILDYLELNPQMLLALTGFGVAHLLAAHRTAHQAGTPSSQA